LLGGEDGHVSDGLEGTVLDYRSRHGLVAEKDLFGGFILVEDKVLRGLIVEENAGFVETVLILEEEHAVFGRTIGTSKITVLEL
jgi:hypothetical protein